MALAMRVVSWAGVEGMEVVRAGRETTDFSRGLHCRPMHGLHLTADLSGCDPALPAMTDPAALRALCVAEVQGAGLQAVGTLFHRFEAAGVTGMVLLAESHVAVHTWPELGAVTLDVYVCNFGADNTVAAEKLIAALTGGFAPSTARTHRLERGRS